MEILETFWFQAYFCGNFHRLLTFVEIYQVTNRTILSKFQTPNNLSVEGFQDCTFWFLAWRRGDKGPIHDKNWEIACLYFFHLCCGRDKVLHGEKGEGTQKYKIVQQSPPLPTTLQCTATFIKRKTLCVSPLSLWFISSCNGPPVDISWGTDGQTVYTYRWYEYWSSTNSCTMIKA